MKPLHHLANVNNLADFIRDFDLAILVVQDGIPRTVIQDTAEVSWKDLGTNTKHGDDGCYRGHAWQIVILHTATVPTEVIEVVLLDKKGTLKKSYRLKQRRLCPGDTFKLTYTINVDRVRITHPQ